MSEDRLVSRMIYQLVAQVSTDEIVQKKMYNKIVEILSQNAYTPADLIIKTTRTYSAKKKG